MLKCFSSKRVAVEFWTTPLCEREIIAPFLLPIWDLESLKAVVKWVGSNQGAQDHNDIFWALQVVSSLITTGGTSDNRDQRWTRLVYWLRSSDWTNVLIEQARDQNNYNRCILKIIVNLLALFYGGWSSYCQDRGTCILTVRALWSNTNPSDFQTRVGYIVVLYLHVMLFCIYLLTRGNLSPTRPVGSPCFPYQHNGLHHNPYRSYHHLILYLYVKHCNVMKTSVKLYITRILGVAYVSRNRLNCLKRFFSLMNTVKFWHKTC